MLVGDRGQDPDNGAPILAKSEGLHELLGDGLSRCDPRVGMIRAAGELDCFSAHIRLSESGKSEEKAEASCKYLWGTSVCNRPFSFVCNLLEFVISMEKKKVTLHLSAPHEQGSKTSSYGLHPYRVDKRSREGG
ncbi:hypothetical protein B296_00040478 [Ensete ventricosum]|uniref:Uncharacterized protein n=1 Tax=Ensete ventricosum TaxID=4639 RepID=A0A426X7Z7_ENSVE|nr:hypothetical protein B296_00040478 [Ensete ventricosum]